MQAEGLTLQQGETEATEPVSHPKRVRDAMGEFWRCKMLQKSHPLALRSLPWPILTTHLALEGWVQSWVGMNPILTLFSMNGRGEKTTEKGKFGFGDGSLCTDLHLGGADLLPKPKGEQRTLGGTSTLVKTLGLHGDVGRPPHHDLSHGFFSFQTPAKPFSAVPRRGAS